MNSPKRWAWLIGVIAMLGVTGAVLAQVSPNFDLHWSLLSGGGGSRASVNYHVGDALGQWADGTSSSTNYRIAAGFWAGNVASGAPHLIIDKSAPAIVTSGSLITYTLIVSNTGDLAASNVVITDVIPVGANYVGGGTRVGNTVQWTVGTLASNSGVQAQFSVTATHTITNSQYGVSAAGGYGMSGAAPIVTVVNANLSDGYEADNTCALAKSIAADGTLQTHNFHVAGDEDWIKFTAQALKTYVIEVDNVGDNVDALVMIYTQCSQPAVFADGNAFGPTIHIEWDAPAAGPVYLQVMQNDPAIFGANTNYDLSVAADTTPPAPPSSLRAAPDHQALIVQWRKSPERDAAGYRIRWGTLSNGPYSGVEDLDDANTTYHQILGLTNGVTYYVVVQARDNSGNWSVNSAEIGQIPAAGGDSSTPVITLNRPSNTTTYTTTVARLTVGGVCTDTGGNLSRISVQNTTLADEKWNYGLSGASMACLVESVPITYGANQIHVTVYDAVNHSSEANLNILRVSGLNGAVAIVGGHNSTFDHQANINYATNRAYRTFRSAGFGAEDIFYLSPSPQDANEDGVNDVISTTTPANVHAAVHWATARVGPGVPFYLYLMDHGLTEAYCGDGCTTGAISSQDLNAWLTELETASGANQVTVIIEACHSGSFIDRFGDVAKSISKDGRVIIASTGRTNNAYASADGAYFSDAFFSAVAESKSVLSSFNQAKAAVEMLPNDQTPWLDDNGDGLSNPTDGAYATNRYVASFFGGLLPEVKAVTVTVNSGSGHIAAFVERGDDLVEVVWAAIYAPSFQSPTTTTLDLGVPLIALQPDLDHAGVYAANYNGFIEPGTYAVIVYARDEAGNQALPRLAQTGQKKTFLPLIRKG